MWDDQTIMMLLEGTRDTLYMTLVSTFFGYVLGLPLGILLAVTDKEGIRPNAPLYKILDVIVNILRSIPFLILLILVIPLTKLIVGQSYGSCSCSHTDSSFDHTWLYLLKRRLYHTCNKRSGRDHKRNNCRTGTIALSYDQLGEWNHQYLKEINMGVEELKEDVG